MLPDNLFLLKLLWDPDDIAGDKIKTSAFRTQELSGKPNDFVSVDRRDMAERAVMERLASSQQSRAIGRDDITRNYAYIGIMNCGELRSCIFDDPPQSNMFEIHSHPVSDNPAHCGIHNVSGRTGRGKIDKMRAILARMSAPINSFDKIFGKPSE